VANIDGDLAVFKYLYGNATYPEWFQHDPLESEKPPNWRAYLGFDPFGTSVPSEQRKPWKTISGLGTVG
jgi:hypothetical protein